PLADRLAAEAGMAFADLIRTGELDRLRICAADDCDAVLVDLTRNRSRIYCDTGNCGNRQHVAAYRARQRGSS
ncbi:MAG TPA: CGNR zinc finger domain-containing protein, partial [Jatrophihabitantaceae bacterium]